MRLFTLLQFTIGCLFVFTVGAKHYEPTWSSLDSRPLPEWYDKAKVGIFIHFGVFSVPSYVDEWFWNWWMVLREQRIVQFMARNYAPNFTYPEFASQFTTELFDAQQWARLFKQSGAQYVVLTSKHHEGFTLWPSKYAYNWNAKDIGPRRDIVGELEKAVRASGLRFGLYHSLMEWFHPLYMQEKKNYFKTNLFVKTKIRPEFEELVTTYKPDIVWSDGDAEAPTTYWNSTDMIAWLYNESPVKDVVVINDRWGIGTSCTHGGFYSCQDRYNPGTLQRHKWENAMTIDKKSWGFRREAELTDFLTEQELISTLVTTVSCGGNLLVNVGPRKDGRIAPIFEKRLLQLGQWLSVNGESIYESNPWTVCQNDTLSPGIWYTQKDEHTVYGFVERWPQAGVVEFGCIKPNLVQSVLPLGFGVNQTNHEAGLVGTIVQFPRYTPKQAAQHVYTFKFLLK